MEQVPHLPAPFLLGFTDATGYGLFALHSWWGRAWISIAKVRSCHESELFSCYLYLYQVGIKLELKNTALFPKIQKRSSQTTSDEFELECGL